MGKVNRYFQMAIFMKDNMKKGKLQERESICGRMELVIKENFKKGNVLE